MGNEARTGTGGWRHRLSRTGAVLLSAAFLAACGLIPAPGGSREPGERRDPESSHAPAAVQEVETGRFQEPGELDRLVDAKPINFPAVKTASAAGAASPIKAPAEPSAGKGRFRIQVGAENDIDAAQSKKAEYERKLGGTVDVVFDAPYYKLRWGYFETKQDADDKILEISEYNIQGFVVKQ
jgi:hypothetical protein